LFPAPDSSAQIRPTPTGSETLVHRGAIFRAIIGRKSATAGAGAVFGQSRYAVLRSSGRRPADSSTRAGVIRSCARLPEALDVVPPVRFVAGSEASAAKVGTVT
jgi:hypothetical protein